MTKADDHFFIFNTTTDISLGFIRVVIALLNIERDFISTAMFGAAQSTNRTGDCREHIGTCTGDDTARKSGCIELMLGVQNQRGMHCTHPQLRRRFTMQQVQEVTADRVVVGLGFNPSAIVAVVVPIQQYRTERSHQTICDIARARGVMIIFLWQDTTQCRNTRPHHIHRMRRCRQPLQASFHIRWQAAQRFQFLLISLQLSSRRQFSVNQQMRDLFKLAALREIKNVISTVMQVITGATYRTKRCITCGNTR